MADDLSSEVRFELGHVLFIDIVGYSKLLTDDQRATRDALNQAVRNANTFRQADAAGRLIKSPTGDGMAGFSRQSGATSSVCT